MPPKSSRQGKLKAPETRTTAGSTTHYAAWFDQMSVVSTSHSRKTYRGQNAGMLGVAFEHNASPAQSSTFLASRDPGSNARLKRPDRRARIPGWTANLRVQGRHPQTSDGCLPDHDDDCFRAVAAKRRIRHLPSDASS